MWSILASPKPFRGHAGVIQRNAITSWARLVPRPEIILFGTDEGTAELCRELGLRHIADVARTESGIPLLNHIIERAKQATANNVLCYINSDILLMSDFPAAVERVARWSDHFLMSGSRWEIEQADLLQFESGWEDNLRAVVAKRGKFQFSGNDFFVFPREFFPQVPPLAIGRYWFDHWFFIAARRLNARIVDVTPVVTVVHQKHDYAHLGASQGFTQRRNPDALRNLELLGNARGSLILESTHQLTPTGIVPLWQRARKAMTRATAIAVPLFAALGIRKSIFGKIAYKLATGLRINQ